MTQHEVAREGRGRRMTDQECLAHEGRLDDIEKKNSTVSGWIKAASGLVGIGMIVLTLLCNAIINKLDSISSAMTDYRVTVAEHTKDLEYLKNAVKSIEERHRGQDQQLQNGKH